MPISKDFNYKTFQYEGRSCKFCNLPVRGRISKVFCNNRCRTTYRNNINSYIKKFGFRTEPEAHNYFLLAKEISARFLPTNVRRLTLSNLEFSGFDFTIPYTQFYSESNQATWFRVGDLLMRIFPSERHVRVKHFSMLSEEHFEERKEITLKKAFPDLGLRSFNYAKF